MSVKFKTPVKLTAKDKTKDIALGTSKLNYIDPRIYYMWLKKHKLAPIDIPYYSKTQLNQTKWANDFITGQKIEFKY
jgi:DNA topoisomerase-1